MSEYTVSPDPQRTIGCLSADPIAYAVALKMLTLHPEACTVALFEGESGWAAVTEMQIAISRWDRETYPNTSRVVTLDGTDESLLRIGFEQTPKENSVFKVTSRLSQALVSTLAQARRVQTFVCYSTIRKGMKNGRKVSEIEEQTTIDEDTVRLFHETGYTREELEALVGRGGSWFGFFRGESCLSSCLVYPTGADVWEIGGVYTSAENRGKGYAKALVQRAVQALLERGRRPRYVFRSDNAASQSVARAVGLTYTNSIEHYLVG